MALTELIFGDKKLLTIGILQFDCSVSETHIDAVEVTEHPIEDGSTISDHIRKLPVQLELNGLVTNTPLVFLATAQAKSPLVGDTVRDTDRVATAYAELKRLQTDGEAVQVITSLESYVDMVVHSVSVQRDAESGNVLNCTISMKEITIAEALSIGLPVPVKVANKKAKNKGKKQKKPVAAEQKRSILSGLVG